MPEGDEADPPEDQGEDKRRGDRPVGGERPWPECRGGGGKADGGQTGAAGEPPQLCCVRLFRAGPDHRVRRHAALEPAGGEQPVPDGWALFPVSAQRAGLL